jgi:hypothetical protein
MRRFTIEVSAITRQKKRLFLNGLQQGNLRGQAKALCPENPGRAAISSSGDHAIQVFHEA